MAVERHPPEPPGNWRWTLLRHLADGRFHSGEALARLLGVSRAAVWKRVRQIELTCGVEVGAVRGRGYRLASPIELLDREGIATLLPHATAACLEQLHVLDTVGSTNAFLVGLRLRDAARGLVCLAERQTAGRGRRGRSWVSPFGANLYLSLLWSFDSPPAGLAGLSLAIGVAVVRALERAGVAGVSLKWPNDVLWRGRKLAGILIELSGEADGPTHAVIGVGLNVRMPGRAATGIDQPWVDLSEVTAGVPPSRNVLAALTIAELVDAAVRFRDGGLESFLTRWGELDELMGRAVRVTIGERVIDGVELGVAPSGALRVATAAGERLFHAGEVSLRPSGPG